MPDSESKIKLPEYPHIPTFVLLLFCGYVVIWYLQVGYRRPALGAIRIEFIWAIGLSILALIYTRADTYRNPLMPYLFLYFLVIVIQVPFSYNPEYSWRIFIDRIIKLAFMAWFIITFVKSPRGLIFFLATFLLVCMKMGQEGFVGQITGSLVWENQGVPRLHGSTPIYTHPNSFSGMAVGTLPFIVFLFPVVNKWGKSILLVQLIFSANIILFTGSRTGWVATCLFLLSLLARMKKITITILVILLIAMLAVDYVPSEYQQRFISIFSLQEQEGSSAETRIQIIHDAWSIFIKHPFGIGVSAFPFVRERYFGRFQDTHNLYLEIATNLGIQGLIVFLFFILKMLIVLKKLEHVFDAKLKSLLIYDSVFDENEFLHKIRFQLNLLKSVSKAVFYFILVRLYLGFFGMDLYEIYWWFSSGLTISLWHINKHIILSPVATNKNPLKEPE